MGRYYIIIVTHAAAALGRIIRAGARTSVGELTAFEDAALVNELCSDLSLVLGDFAELVYNVLAWNLADRNGVSTCKEGGDSKSLELHLANVSISTSDSRQDFQNQVVCSH